jgi:hypothetical protein
MRISTLSNMINIGLIKIYFSSIASCASTVTFNLMESFFEIIDLLVLDLN